MDGRPAAFVSHGPGVARPLVPRALALALMVLVLGGSGCTSGLSRWWHNGGKLGPDYCPPPAPLAASWVTTEPRTQAGLTAEAPWWTVFNDPTLNALVENAYRQNLTLRTAAARILQARAQRNIAAGNLFPQSQTAVGGYAHGQISRNLTLPFPPNFDVWATGFNASWELDFWGRYRRLIESSNAAVDASMEGYNDALVILLAEVATNYVQMRTYEERLRFARHNVEIQQGSLQLTQAKFNGGVGTELDVRQATSSLAQTEANIPPLEAGRRQAINQLCILLGQPVTDIAAGMPLANIPVAPVRVAAGIPAELLRRRPDIRQAERQVASQSAQIGVAEADLYPRFAINGFLGYAASDLDHLFGPKSVLGFVIPSFQWNVLNYGRVTNNIRVQEAKLQEVTLEYQQKVLTAGREVEDALVAFVKSHEQAIKLGEGVTAAERSVELVGIQFNGGIVDFNRVYNTQTLLVNEQDQLAQTRGNIAINLINVYRALGGGWQYFCGGGMPLALPAPPDAAPAEAVGGQRPPERLPPAGPDL